MKKITVFYLKFVLWMSIGTGIDAGVSRACRNVNCIKHCGEGGVWLF